MTIRDKIQALVAIAFITLPIASCKNENHIDKYKVQLDSLKTLPNRFYAYRGDRVFLEESEDYRIWFNLDDHGNVLDIFRIEDFKNRYSEIENVIQTYFIDTSLNKSYAQAFIELSRKYKFGHIHIDKENKISFSSNEGIVEQYVKTLNDSVNHFYSNNNEFKLLQNGWFEYIER